MLSNEPMQKPYLNLGCGHVILPTLDRPAHHAIVDEAIYHYPLWHNVDRNAGAGVDEVVDIFTYPWPWVDNSFDGALLSHIAEHVPHEIKINPLYEHRGIESVGTMELSSVKERCRALQKMQDGWYAFFSELHRVLTPGAVAHILSPYGWSQGAITDPTHTRLLTEHTFTHSMRPDPAAPFTYETGGLHFEMEEGARFGITEPFQHLIGKGELLQQALMTQINVAYDLYVKLRAVKSDAED